MKLAMFVLFSVSAFAQLRPNPALTPGAVNPRLTQSVICSPTFRTGPYRNVPSSRKARVYAEYYRTKKKGICCEVDHLISLELGGSNDITNLWPQPYLPKPGALEKDKAESWLHREVCAGRMSLESAQRAISADWYVVYEQMEKDGKPGMSARRR